MCTNYFVLSWILLNNSSNENSSKLGKKSTAKEVIESYGEGKYLLGKTAIVTGGNSGIGLETVKALAYAGCRVILCSRSIDAGLKAIKSELEKPGEGNYIVEDTSNIIVKQLDLASLKSIKLFCNDILASNERIDFLVLNAGIMALPKAEYTDAGFEKQIGVNHYGHAYLTSLLYNKISKQDFPSRIIVLSSSAHSIGSFDFNDIHYKNGRWYSAYGAYGQSKLANVLYAKSLADKLIGTKATAYSVHPGIIRTNLYKPKGFLEKIVTSLIQSVISDKNIPQGASTTIWACVSTDLNNHELNGSYLVDCIPTLPSKLGQDTSGTLRQKLWEITERDLKNATENI